MALNVTFSNVWGNNSERMERGVKQDHNCADSWSDRPYLLFGVPKFVLKNQERITRVTQFFYNLRQNPCNPCLIKIYI